MASTYASRVQRRSATALQNVAWVILLVGTSVIWGLVLLAILGKIQVSTYGIAFAFWIPILSMGVFGPNLILPEEMSFNNENLQGRVLIWLLFSVITAILMVNWLGPTLPY